MRSIGTASFFALCLAIAGCNNGTTTGTDAGGGTDSGTPTTDTGTPATDTGTPATDTGTPATDTGTQAEDANVQTDANLPTECPSDFADCMGGVVDHTADDAVTITIDGLALRYVAPCIRVHAGTMVTVPGSVGHPLIDAACSPSDSPLPATMSTTGGTYTFDHPGTYGYECTLHAALGMRGLIIVE